MRSYHRMTGLVAGVVLTLALALAACSSSDNPAPGGPSGTAGPAKVSINVAVASKLAGHWALWSGLNQGIFRDDGVTVIVTTVATDSAGVQALQSGSVDVIIGTIPQIIRANAAGANLVGVAAVQNRPIYRMIAGKNIPDVSALKGKKAGVSEVALGVDSYLMQAWLKTQGISKDEYTLVGVGGVATRVAALSSGGVDVIAVPPPGDQPVIKQGYTDLGFASDRIEHLQWTLLVTTKSSLEKNTPAIKQFLAAYVKAAQFVVDPKNKDAAQADLVKETGTTPEAAAAAYTLMVDEHGISPDGTPDAAGITAWGPLLGVADVAAKSYNGNLLPTG
jgi:ABC-type nitrate/sulfonate/bicarbonate transport system substrate-binding protein